MLIKMMSGAESFQSTLPVWGATGIASLHSPSTLIFQSTLPVWGATNIILKYQLQ